MRPTITSAAPELRCEVHLLDPPEGNLYRQRLEVQLIERLRSDRKFPSLEALQRQIARDLEDGRSILDRRMATFAPIAG